MSLVKEAVSAAEIGRSIGDLSSAQVRASGNILRGAEQLRGKAEQGLTSLKKRGRKALAEGVSSARKAVNPADVQRAGAAAERLVTGFQGMRGRLRKA